MAPGREIEPATPGFEGACLSRNERPEFGPIADGDGPAVAGQGPVHDATVHATEEAIVNALVAAETMDGINGNTAQALPKDQLRAILAKYNRLVP